MSKIKIQGDAGGTGIFTIASPNSSTDRTITLPDDAGTIVTSAQTTTAAYSFVIDEDNLASDLATKVPTQQSVKAYVDAQVTAQDLDFQGDSGGALSIDLDSETLDIAGGTGIDTVGSGNTVTASIDSTVTTLTGSQTLTNKTLTSAVLNTGVSGTAVLDEDAMGSNSATQLATQQSIKAYVDGQTTDETAEGSTNLYHTTARARAAVSVTDAGGDGSCTYNSSTGVITYTGPGASEARAHISVTDAGGDGSAAYNSTTGVITYTGPSAAEVRAHISVSGDLAYSSGVVSFTERTDAEVKGLVSVTDAGGDGSLAYNSSTGVITYTGPSAAEVRAHLSAGTGITYSGGAISIGQAVATSSDVQFADLILSGDLTVNGTTTTVASTNTTHTDALIEYGNGTTGTPANDAGIVIERGDAANAFIGFDESADKFTVGTGTFTGASTGNLSITTGTMVANLEGATADLTGNITVGGTVDGRDVAADGTKLDGIASSANLYVHPNHSGDVVSTADGATVIQVDAVDIPMLSATGTASSTTFLRGDNTWGTPIGGVTSVNSVTGAITAANIKTAYEGETNAFTDAQFTKLSNIETAADVTDTANVTTAGALMDSELASIAAIKATTGTFLTADQTKLDTIETSATADQTAAQLLTAIKTVDGAGSGLDADLLDAQSSAYFRINIYNAAGTLLN